MNNEIDNEKGMLLVAVLTFWLIGAGRAVEWEKELYQYLESADIILLLIGPDFMASDYCVSITITSLLLSHKIIR